MEQIRSSKKCVKCSERFEFLQEDTWWDYSGYTDVKLVKCPNCNTINPIKYRDTPGLYVNTDKRYY